MAKRLLSAHAAPMAVLGTRRFQRSYAFEKLFVELGAVFLGAELGILDETGDDHTAFLAAWR